jgi:hypothetical protein
MKNSSQHKGRDRVGRPTEAAEDKSTWAMRRAMFAPRRLLWLIDNSVSLHCYVKGRASHAGLDRSVAATKFLQARLPAVRAAHGRAGVREGPLTLGDLV